MRTISVAVFSFLGGVVFALALASGWSSKSASAQMGAPVGYEYVPKIMPPRFNVPMIPGIGAHMDANIFVGGFDETGKQTYVLDGLEAHDNIFSNPAGIVFRYGGGAYRLERASIGGPVTLELIGAAANTAQLLQTFGLLPAKEPPSVILAPPTLQKNTIIKRHTNVKRPYKGDMLSTFDGT